MDTRTNETEKYMREFSEFFGKWISVFLLLILGLFFYQQSSAAEFYLEGGTSIWKRPPENLWWQTEYQHTDNFNSLFLRAGVNQPILDHLSVGVSVFNLGRYSQHADAADESCYLPTKNGSCPISDRYHTSGSAWGYALTTTIYTPAKMFFVEAGPTYIRQSFRQTQDNFPGFEFKRSHTAFGYVFGLGVEYKSWTVSIKRFDSNVGSKFVQNDGEEFPGTGTVHVVSIGKIF